MIATSGKVFWNCSCVLYAFTLPHFASVRIVPLDDFFWCASPYTLVEYEEVKHATVLLKN